MGVFGGNLFSGAMITSLTNGVANILNTKGAQMAVDGLSQKYLGTKPTSASEQMQGKDETDKDKNKKPIDWTFWGFVTGAVGLVVTIIYFATKKNK